MAKEIKIVEIPYDTVNHHSGTRITLVEQELASLVNDGYDIKCAGGDKFSSFVILQRNLPKTADNKDDLPSASGLIRK